MRHAFVNTLVTSVWNDGRCHSYNISGDKSNHIPAFHVPQLYYFVGFATAFGWPALVSGKGGVLGLAHEVRARMFGSKKNAAVTGIASAIMCLTIYKFTCVPAVARGGICPLMLLPSGSSTHSCCLTIAITPSTYGDASFFSIRWLRTSSFQGTSRPHGHGTFALVRSAVTLATREVNRG